MVEDEAQVHHLADGELAVDGTVLFLAIPSLTADLAPTATQILWIGDIYSFVLAGLLITMGNLADRIGRKRLLLIGATAFGAASLAGGGAAAGAHAIGHLAQGADDEGHVILIARATRPELEATATYVLRDAGADKVWSQDAA